jgi:hypothetical protein
MTHQQFAYLLVSAAIVWAVLQVVPVIRSKVRSEIAAGALSLLTALAGTLVQSVADEVRTLKGKPGEWTPDEAKKIKARVVDELRTFGRGALSQISDLQGLSKDALSDLLDRLVEQQVDSLRARASSPASVNVLVPSIVPPSA